jgi:hypothetical protein
VHAIADRCRDGALGFRDGVTKGCNVPPVSPSRFVDMVISEPHRREPFRTEYEGEALRDQPGLPGPASNWRQVTMVAE